MMIVWFFLLISTCMFQCIILPSSRDPFFCEIKRNKPDIKEYVLRGTIITDYPLAHIEYDKELFIVAVHEKIGSFIVEKIEPGKVVLLKDNERKVLELDQRMGEEA